MDNKNIYLNKCGINNGTIKPIILLFGPIFLLVIFLFNFFIESSFLPSPHIIKVIIVLTTISLSSDTLNNLI